MERLHGAARKDEVIVYRETKQHLKPSVKNSKPKDRKQH
jgi:hypothetical protein